jgi:predicted DNA-binding transcriptional regulator YafY
MVRKRSSITLSISDQEKAQLEQLALDFGQTWGENANISKLIKAIAKGSLRIAANHNWGRDRIDTLNHALNLLKDEGYFSEALVLADLLLERSELNRPLRQEIQSWVDEPGSPWRVQIDDFIRCERPFRLAYQDAADRIWSFSVRFASIERHEDRQYLDCWCDSTEGNQDVEALKHNWTLRLDRIPSEAVISPVEGTWQSGLDTVEVEFRLLNRLALGYRSKTGADLVSEWLPEQQVRRVVRRIHSTFWFFREMRRYGADCVIVGPSEVRDRFVADLTETMKRYQQGAD